ncbi:MAG: glycosyltransferase, partial [Bacteroidales bacterium]|nr:glycosyltransferase [Bacteroidales bacterium]
YCRMLDEFSPDLVLFFDNSLITLLTADEARRRGIPAVVYLAHGNNRGSRWCRDVSLMVTDTHATAGLYKQRENYDLVPVGTFIDPGRYRAEGGAHSNVLFINPSLDKGVVFVIQLALMMEKSRPDIRFEVVEARSRWQEALRVVSARLGEERTELSNVSLTPNVQDMRPVYARAKVLLVPSVWWDSGPRVIVEAMLNGIPVLGSSSGGIPENIGDGGMIIDFPPEYFQPPYDKLFGDSPLAVARDFIIRLFDDREYCANLSQAALDAHAELHDMEKNTGRLLQVFEDTVARARDKRPA